MQAAMHKGSSGVPGRCFTYTVVVMVVVDRLYKRFLNGLFLNYFQQACQERIKSDTSGEAHCTGQVSFEFCFLNATLSL